MEVNGKAVEGFYAVLNLAFAATVTSAVRVALQLRIPDILAAAGPGASLTPQQIADALPRKTPDAAPKVGKILRLLAHKGVFAASPDSETGIARYGLTDVSKYFVTGSEFEMTALITLHETREWNASLEHLREIVEEDADGFQVANGSDLWSYVGAHPEFSDVFNAAMRSSCKVPNAVLARHYEGFKDLDRVVDIGGGVGAALAAIVAAHPHIRGTNFDLPHVVSTAPNIPGVEHVAGSFLEFVPSGDAILLQRVLHDWGDEDCIKILKNCHQALPQNGKVLIRENVINSSRSSAAKTSVALASDVLMMTLFRGGVGERTAAEWKRLLEAAAFSHTSFQVVHDFDLIEAVKI